MIKNQNIKLKRIQANISRVAVKKHTQKNKLEAWASISTIIASAIAIVALILGYFQFATTQESERDKLAYDFVFKYSELMKPDRDTTTEADVWKDDYAIGLAEAIYRLRNDDYGWTNTVISILYEHKDFIKSDNFNPSKYNADFVALTKEVANN